MGVTMMCRFGALFALPLATAVSAVCLTSPAFAAELPQIKITDGNKVPECATPGRLSAFLEARNKNLNGRFQTIAADYMRVGEELGIRWDVAYFQMLLETGNMTFTGDVSPEQNNFAGLGATGKKEPGESFPDVATGVKAHLQHLLMYAGENVENPVAERTRKVQEWGVLTSWLKTIDGPMTYTHLAKKWAPGSRNYSRDIANVSESFYEGLCKSADPKPEMMALARPSTETKTASLKAQSRDAAPADAPEASSEVLAAPKVSGAELARRAVAEARASGSFVRSNLGAGAIAKAAETAATASPETSETPPAQPAFTIINAPKPEVEAAETEAPAAAATPVVTRANEPAALVQTAALGSGTKAGVTPPPASKSREAATPPPSTKCRVWTASYGGSRAIIIKAAGDQTTNYTVLDVNEGTEKREAEAYIAAYAKGGEAVGDFANQTQALDKAFELCPEG